jgi:hypothetical protein
MIMKKKMVLPVVVALIALIVGFLGGYFVAMGTRQGSATSGLLGLPNVAAPTTLVLPGKVTAIQGGMFTMSSPVMALPGENQLPTTREVTVTAATSFTLTQPVSSAEIQQEISAQQKQIAAAAKAGKSLPSSALLLPASTAQSSSTFSALQVGDNVVVFSDNDIRSAESFTATMVQIVGNTPQQ